jgi:2-polyprenyl-3-methyl-5-hydroxy-6-metoxy-1,4-benzoquinol methylase
MSEALPVEMSKYFVRSDCRLCNGSLERVLELNSTPPANEFVRKEFIESKVKQDEFPLFLSRCMKCGHTQLPVVVPPERLFTNYIYVSGTSKVFVDHFEAYAKDVWSVLRIGHGDLIVDIGSNDGTLLKAFKRIGCKVLGVDPARAIAKKASDEGIQTLPEFFTKSLAEKIASDHGKAKVIVANNVFAHADDLRDIAIGVSKLLSYGGIFVFEVSYLPSVLKDNLFDTIYHEHLSYHHLAPLVPFFDSVGLEIFDAKLIPTHGGSIRVYVGFAGRSASPRMLSILENEKMIGLSDLKDLKSLFTEFQNRIDSLGFSLRLLLNEFHSSGRKIAGFGAPAKVTTLMHQFNIGSGLIDFIVDDSPLKQGLYTPGKFIPVLPTSALYDRNVDYILILAWNFAESIMKTHSKFVVDSKRFIVPIPEVRVYP